MVACARRAPAAATTSAISLPDSVLRLTTDAPISYIETESAFVLTTPINLVLGPDESVPHGLGHLVRDFQERTIDYWIEWTRYLSVPFEWQEAVIRAAITLKLCHFEETGAMVAALTTSIPEAAGYRAQLGLSRLLAARCLSLGPGAEPPRRDQDDGRLPRLHHHHRRPRGRCAT